MVKTDPKSRIEVWRGEYINNSPSSTGTTIRTDEDKNVDILQIEPGNSPDDYIVEIVEKKEDGEKCEDTGEDYYPFIEGFRDAMEVVSDAFKTMNDDPNFEYSRTIAIKAVDNIIGRCLEARMKELMDKYRGE